MTRASKPLSYTCSITGVSFPKIYRIHYPATYEYDLVPHSQTESPGMPERQVDEVYNLGPDSGVDLHLSYFDSKEKAAGFVEATKYWHQHTRVYPTELHLDKGYYVLVAIKSPAAKGRVYFNVCKGLSEHPTQAVFDQNGSCVRPPSDC